MKWIIMLVSFIIIIVLILITSIRINMTYKHEKDDDLFELKVYLAFLKVYTSSAPLIKVDDDSASIIVKEKTQISGKEQKKRQTLTPAKLIKDIQWFNGFLREVVDLHRIVKKFLAKVNVHELKWHTEVGIGDAAHTAQFVGIIWTLKGTFIGILSHYFKVNERPILSVHPLFQGFHSQLNFSCIISFRSGHAIVAGLMLLKHWKRRPKWLKNNSVKETM